MWNAQVFAPVDSTASDSHDIGVIINRDRISTETEKKEHHNTSHVRVAAAIFIYFFHFFFVTLFVSVSGFVSQIAQALPIATLITTQHKGEEGKVVAGINLMNQNDPLFLDSVNFLSYLAFKTVAGCILTNI